MRISTLIIISGLLLFVSSTVRSQDLTGPINTALNVVISPNGLSIRSQPNLKSKKLAVVPFGKQVNIISEENFGVDTIGEYQFYYGGGPETNYPIIGQWVKVNYKAITGFMFNAYLHQQWNSDTDFKEMNSDYALLFPGEDCFENIVFHPKMKWYGIYKDPSSGKIQLKSTTIGFFRSFGDLTSYGITAGDNQHLLYIIGSKNELKERTLDGFGDFLHGQHNYQFTDRHRAKLNDLGISWSGENWMETTITVKSGSQEQVLNPKNSQMTAPLYMPWIGDIDGDGIDDYIINYGEKTNYTVLYLSSQAEEGQLVKPVAAYFAGYCC